MSDEISKLRAEVRRLKKMIARRDRTIEQLCERDDDEWFAGFECAMASRREEALSQGDREGYAYVLGAWNPEGKGQ